MTATLKWHYGPMSAGKSTLALQLNHNLRSVGRRVLLFTRQDRSGRAVISSRLGISADAIEVTDTVNLANVVRTALDRGENITYIIADEAQFYTVAQVEQLADIVDHLGITVSAFGIPTDFTSTMFAASKRLFEIATEHIPLPVQGLCWCGEPGQMNARVVNGVMVTEGEQVMVGDMAGDSVHYVVLCRRHFRAGQHRPPAITKATTTG